MNSTNNLDSGRSEMVFSIDYFHRTELVDLVAHYFVNNTLKFFKEDDITERNFMTMPFSEEFVESKYSAQGYFQQQLELSRMSEGSSIWCGCGSFSSCIPGNNKKKIRDKMSVQYREKQEMMSRSIKAPYWSEVAKLINFILTGLKCNEKTAKSVCLLALIIMETTIIKSQNISLRNFRNINIGELSDILNLT